MVCAVIGLSLCSRFVLSALDDPPDASSPAVEAPAPEAPTPEPAANANPNADTAQDQPAPPLTEQSYVGTNQCFMCHRPQTNSWSESKHAEAFTRLPEMYHRDTSCLKCHVTAFGEAKGFVAGTDKDLLIVGCESCHGPGALHIDAARRYVLSEPGQEAKIEKEMRDTILKTPTDTVCIKCHTTQAHGSHPAYQHPPTVSSTASSTQQRPVLHGRRSPAPGAPAWYYSGFSVKTCGSCHYERYKQWSTEAHSALSAVLPAKYTNDQTCSTCHPTSHGAIAAVANTAGSQDGRIGAACESCHGPGLQHVQFNRRFIGPGRLGPKLEEAVRLSMRSGKPKTACIQCHVGQSHKQHPEYEKPGENTAH
jgi:hypothetical protein